MAFFHFNSKFWQCAPNKLHLYDRSADSTGVDIIAGSSLHAKPKISPSWEKLHGYICRCRSAAFFISALATVKGQNSWDLDQFPIVCNYARSSVQHYFLFSKALHCMQKILENSNGLVTVQTCFSNHVRYLTLSATRPRFFTGTQTILPTAYPWEGKNAWELEQGWELLLDAAAAAAAGQLIPISMQNNCKAWGMGGRWSVAKHSHMLHHAAAVSTRTKLKWILKTKSVPTRLNKKFTAAEKGGNSHHCPTFWAMQPNSG